MEQPGMLTRAMSAQLENEPRRRCKLMDWGEESKRSEEGSSSQGGRSSGKKGGGGLLPRKEDVHTDTPWPYAPSQEASSQQ